MSRQSLSARVADLAYSVGGIAVVAAALTWLFLTAVTAAVSSARADEACINVTEAIQAAQAVQPDIEVATFHGAEAAHMLAFLDTLASRPEPAAAADGIVIAHSDDPDTLLTVALLQGDCIVAFGHLDHEFLPHFAGDPRV